MDIRLVSHAKDYIDDLAKGINPITKEEISENDVINNVKISRCLYYVSEVLGEVIESGGVKKPAQPKQAPLTLDSIDVDAVEVSSTAVTISVIAKRINAAKPETMKNLKVTAITNWLVSIEMLRVNIINNKNVKRVTDKGRAIGLNEEERAGQYGKYISVTYNKAAQQFIIDNLPAIFGGGFND